jgi:hypothetical protein
MEDTIAVTEGGAILAVRRTVSNGTRGFVTTAVPVQPFLLVRTS